MKRRLFAGFTLFALLIAFAASAIAGEDRDKNFFDNGDGTATHNPTGVTWQKTVDSTRRPFLEAADYCHKNTAGLPGSGWRLPHVSELRTLIYVTVLGGLAQTYWSDHTDHNFYGPTALSMDLPGGMRGGQPLKSLNHVRCVRY